MDNDVRNKDSDVRNKDSDVRNKDSDVRDMDRKFYWCPGYGQGGLCDLIQ